MQEYDNPVIPGFYPDPSICRVENDYYLVCSSFEYCPGIPIFHSKDLVHWEQIGHCLTRASQQRLDNAPCSGGVWAPTIRWHNGIFYVTATNECLGGNFYVYSTDPASQWSEPIHVNMGGIDPSFLFDNDGRVYYQTNQPSNDGKPGISQAEIEILTGNLLSEPRFIWAGTGGRAPEAPHIYHIGEWYYLMIAEGGTQFGHMATIARSKSPWGPFMACPANPILTNLNTPNLEVHCTGHGDLVQDHNGSWWMVHLGIRIARKYMSHLGRETFLVPVKWDQNGWPLVNHGECVDVISRADTLPAVPVRQEPSSDTFCELSEPGFHWCSLRKPADFYEITANGLVLHGNAYDLDDIATPAFLARRQRYFDCVIECKMEFEPQSENEEAGIAIMISNEFYYKFCKKIIDDVPKICVTKRASDFYETTGIYPITSKKATILRIEATREKYQFFVDDDGLIELATASTRFLACEVVGRCFTGTVIGMYATGKGCACKTPAIYEYFSLHRI